MSDLDQVLEAGTLLMIETGEYSDYSFHGPVKMLVSKTKRELADEYRETWQPEAEWDDIPTGGWFMPWLIRKGYAEDVPNVHSWHIGSYGTFNP